MKQFRRYLYGRKFTLVTDHRTLCWLLTLRDSSTEPTRWVLQLSESECTVFHQLGKYHLVPDAQSRQIATFTSEGPVALSQIKIVLDVDTFCNSVESDLKDLNNYHLDEGGLFYRSGPDGGPKLVRIPLRAWMFSVWVFMCVFLYLCTGRGLATS
jgi:hypothetical protein